MDLNPSRIQGDALGIKIPSDFYFRIYDSPTNFLKWDTTHLMTHPLKCFNGNANSFSNLVFVEMLR